MEKAVVETIERTKIMLTLARRVFLKARMLKQSPITSKTAHSA